MKDPKTGLVLARCAAAISVGFAALPSWATLVVSGVQLIAPGGLIGDSTPLDLSQSLSAANPILQSTDPAAGQISNFMLAGEQISISANSILIQAASGNVDGSNNLVTGYLGLGVGAHARYQFDGLSIAGQTITGFNVFAFDG